jgi:hypothetical protein
MKNYLILLSLTIGLPVFAQTELRFEKMNALMIENGVHAWGRYEARDASFVCKISRRTKALFCNLRSSGSDIHNDIYVEFHGDKARDVSELLKEFKALPEGRNERQDLLVGCRLKKRSAEFECDTYDPNSINN